ncbi:unnamed protein product [Blepharisma stoltei]|uniref:AB hydrolase-1 domain-containing protein n=1 Tax=Blepharisma stoltei TaxID=1481888 RepID=A0AAU9JNI9_9CILI|nr:unnamed protein product [Blepharisma stoltei]
MQQHFFHFGTGDPIIWLHGFLGNGLNISGLARGIHGSHYLLDARNHGRSFHSLGMGYDLLAKDLFEFMDLHEIKYASIVGYSMGAKTAIYASGLQPWRFNKVVVIDAAPVDYTNILTSHYENLYSYLYFMKDLKLEGKHRKEYEEEIDKKFKNPIITSLISSNLRMNGANSFEWRVNVDYLIEGLKEIPKWEENDRSFDGPAMAIVGEKSRHTCEFPGIDVKDLYSKYLPELQIEVILGTGHYLYIEKSKEVQEALSDFLSKF